MQTAVRGNNDDAVPHFDGIAASGRNGLAAPGNTANEQTILQIQRVQRTSAEIAAGSNTEFQRLHLVPHDLAHGFHTGI